MTEDDAKAWLCRHFGDDPVLRLRRFVDLVLDENQRQNLISRSSEQEIWARHVVDSAQLLQFTHDRSNILDVGSGPGFPGLVMAALSQAQFTLVEPRPRRTAFMEAAAQELGLHNVEIVTAKVQHLKASRYDAVVARAYASLPEIFATTAQFTDSSTVWILPKGRSAARELAEARKAWQGVFHVERSLTGDDAEIVIASGVMPR